MWFFQHCPIEIPMSLPRFAYFHRYSPRKELVPRRQDRECGGVGLRLTSPNIKILISFFAHKRLDSQDTEFPMFEFLRAREGDWY